MAVDALLDEGGGGCGVEADGAAVGVEDARGGLLLSAGLGDGEELGLVDLEAPEPPEGVSDTVDEDALEGSGGLKALNDAGLVVFPLRFVLGALNDGRTGEDAVGEGVERGPPTAGGGVWALFWHLRSIVAGKGVGVLAVVPVAASHDSEVRP